MSVKPETAAAVKKLVELDARIGKAKKDIDADMAELSKGLPAAIKAKQRNMIELHLKTVGALIGKITDTLADADKAIGAVDVVEEDEDFLAERARREPVTQASQRVNDAKDALTKTFADAKKLQNVGEQGLVIAKAAQQDKMAELARLDRGIKAHLKEAKSLAEKSDAVYAKAEHAVATRSRHALKAAIAELDKLPLQEAYDNQGSFVATLDRFEKEVIAAKPPADTLATLKDGINDLRGVLKQSQVFTDRIIKHYDGKLFLEITEVDVKQSLKVLALAPKYEGKLKLALEGPAAARVKALDAIAKEAHLGTDGRAMEQALIKRKVLVA